RKESEKNPATPHFALLKRRSPGRRRAARKSRLKLHPFVLPAISCPGGFLSAGELFAASQARQSFNEPLNAVRSTMPRIPATWPSAVCCQKCQRRVPYLSEGWHFTLRTQTG